MLYYIIPQKRSSCKVPHMLEKGLLRSSGNWYSLAMCSPPYRVSCPEEEPHLHSYIGFHLELQQRKIPNLDRPRYIFPGFDWESSDLFHPVEVCRKNPSHKLHSKTLKMVNVSINLIQKNKIWHVLYFIV